MNFIIQGEIVSKKNTWQRAKWGGIYQSKQKELDDIIWQLKSQKTNKEPLRGDIYLSVVIHGSNRRDGLNELETLADCLQNAGVIFNDRQIKQVVFTKHIVKKNFRAGIWLEETTKKKKRKISVE